MYTIDKSFDFCYGHRVHQQVLNLEFTEEGHTVPKCRHLHGHQGKVQLFLERANLNEQGMVEDFSHLGWLKTFLDEYIDHKFVLDVNDPWFAGITNTRPVLGSVASDGDWLLGLTPTTPFATTDESSLAAIPVYAPNTYYLAGYNANTANMSGPEKELYSGFFFVNFLPTSENLCKWLFDLASVKMARLGVKVARVDWWETPKSRSSYSGE